MAEYDLVVVGGGMAGICAAIQGARLGLKTMLIEREIVLGGNANSTFKLHLEGANSPENYSRETGIIEELEAEAMHETAFIEPSGRMYGFFNSMFSEILRRKCEESGLELLLKTVVTGIEKTGSRVSKVKAFDMLAHKHIEIDVKGYVVDASGDGVVALPAGAEYRMGREAKAEFGEEFAPDKADNRMMGSALMFLLRNTGRPVKYTPPPGTPVFKTQDELPMYSISAWDPTTQFAMIWTTEYGGDIDTMMDDRQIYDRLLKNVHGITDFIKNRGEYGAENHELFWISEFIGKREGRRFIGDYVLSQKDMFGPADFPDAVAYGGRSVDLHEVSDDSKQYKVIFYGRPPLYSIPLRCLYSKDVDNLFLTGRLISGTRVALGSYRVQKTLSTTGQAVGAAAYLCIKRRITPRQLASDPKDLRQLLLKEDATILNAINEDPEDLARSAQVSASSELPDSPAVNVINGINRLYPGSPTNMWVSSYALPQHLDLKFSTPTPVNSIQLTFDTELNANRGPDISLKAFPCTARDYRIYGCINGQHTTLAEVKDNYQRLRRHTFPAVTVDSIRIIIDADNGNNESARLFEIRVY